MKMCSAPRAAGAHALCFVGYSCPSSWREEQDLLQNLPSTTAYPHICRHDLESSNEHLPIHLEQRQREFL